jgi:hypothetical protein
VILATIAIMRLTSLRLMHIIQLYPTCLTGFFFSLASNSTATTLKTLHFSNFSTTHFHNAGRYFSF